jgi:hypothetical protein
MRRTAFVLIPVLLSAQIAGAGQAPQTPTTTTTSNPFSTAGPPYSVERVKRELRQLPPTTITEKQDGLKLEYYIQVFGTAPKIDFFKGVDLKNGPVPFTAPTHADMLEQMTPQQYRHKEAYIPSLLVWLGQQLTKKKK